MEIAVKTVFFGLTPKIVAQKQIIDVRIPILSLKGEGFSWKMQYKPIQFCQRANPQNQLTTHSKSSSESVEEIEVSSLQSQGFSVTSGTSKDNEVKISIEVSGTRTQTTFDEVFSRMVAAAQPIPGFRRVKGGETPNIPRDVLLQVLGPSKVYKQVIKKIINSTISEFIKEEGLAVSKNLRIEQSFHDLEEAFEPGQSFSFDAVMELQ